MPTALSDPSFSLYVVVGVIAGLFGIVAVRRQKRSDFINFAIPLAALIALFVIDKMYESPREQTVRKINEMSQSSKNKKHDELFKHVSDSFKYRTNDKKWFQDKAKQAEGAGYGAIAVWDLARSTFKENEDGTVEQGFRVGAEGQGAIQFYVRGTFKKEADGEWRMISFKLFDPININDEKPIPGS